MQYIKHEPIFDKSLTYHEYIFKLIIIGNSGVGKSSLLKRLIDNEFDEDTEVTVGVEFGSFLVRLQDKVVKLQIWDTAGQESFKSITKIFYRGSQCVFLCYNITKPETFNALESWLHEIKANCSNDAQIYLVGNGIDQEDQREITPEAGAEFARQNGLAGFYETSAKSGENVVNLFVNAGKLLFHTYKDMIK